MNNSFQDQQRSLSRFLLNLGAVKLSFEKKFQWASGIESPIYCDNRLLISDVEARDLICNMFSQIVKEEFAGLEVVAGTATAGIPHAAWLSKDLQLPMVYVRSKAKSHGTKSLVEGFSTKAKKVLVIEDLISTGGSSIQAVQALREEGAEVVGVLSIFSYSLKKAERAFKEAGVIYKSLGNVDMLFDVATELKLVSEKDRKALNAFFDTLNA